MLNPLLILVIEFIKDLGVLGTWQTQNRVKILRCLTVCEREESFLSKVVPKLVKHQEQEDQFPNR